MNTYYPNPFGSSLLPGTGAVGGTVTDSLQTSGYPGRYPDAQMYAQMCVGQTPYGSVAPPGLTASNGGPASGTTAGPPHLGAPPHIHQQQPSHQLHQTSAEEYGSRAVQPSPTATALHGAMMPDWNSAIQSGHPLQPPPPPLQPLQIHSQNSLPNGSSAADFSQMQAQQRHISTPNGGFPSSQSSSPGNAPFYPWMGVVGKFNACG